MRTLSALALILVATGTAQAAYDPVVLKRGWERVDRFEGAECSGEVGTNGRFYVISAEGFAPGERAFLTITNGDMPPIERSVRIDGQGNWQDYYIPFRYNHVGGAVAVTLATADCVVPLGFTWQRAKGWDEPAPLIPSR